ncbi:Lrp/AsnC family transcriptional regulator [Priestia megaterium]|jgi:Lrp/AsnC family transcriptional regulator, leucine-responsive regulatory protein|uniref:AsnC family transcriptional regulator n=3 Tax=Priestia megaterium TaxID=1404 RepID=A0A6M6DXM1_PRIMG|nr:MULTISPECIES: Lrp/AsnC family transcriptional regulator [Priestia]MCJ7988258.1 Lrp/AsnC family transcriptional regulator [Priestia sp. OVS21]HWL24275.1 Lrp/AsnC family transcriptional regulator [Ureibacillus sp.]AJI22484.1 asnC-type helix-turn-helix domain protein [Priestia megaterium NBRC 15308 = ATCC 14581]AYE51904.1 Lrp/AsnC family transcriptional regulator [Priestia megaterium NCT-2]KFM96253.1 asnC family protein [Priestia megaterium]
MDEIDKNILLHLQENARLSVTQLGKLVGLSTPAVNERVKKLEEKNIIDGYRAIINPENFNKPVTAFILYSNTNCRQFVEYCKEHPEVIECHRLAGQYNYLVKVLTNSVQSLETFIDESMAFGQPSTLIKLSSPVVYKAIK